MEGYRIIEPFDFDPSVLLNENSTTNIILRDIVYQAAVRYQWKTLSGTADKYTIRGFDKTEFCPEPATLIWTQSYMRPNEVMGLDVFMMHMYVNHEKKTWGVVAYVFPQPEVNSEGHKYFEYSNFNIFQEGSRIIFEKTNTYADCADIHDHDHYKLSTQVIYDINTRTLSYPED